MAGRKKYFQVVLRLLAVLAVTAVLIETAYVWRFSKAHLEQRSASAFITETDDSVELLTNRLEVYADSLYSGRGLFAASGYVSRPEWERFIDAQYLLSRYPGMGAISYIAAVKPKDRIFYDKWLLGEYQATGIVTSPLMDSASDQYVLSYIFPLKGNESVVGRNFSLSPERFAAMDKARSTGLPTATLPVKLAVSKTTGFLVYLPMYVTGQPTETESQRQEALIGFTSAAFRAGELLSPIYSANGVYPLAVSIKDVGSDCGVNCELYVSPTFNQKSTGLTVYTADLSIAQRSWRLTFQSDPNFSKSRLDRILPTIVLVSGMGLAFFIAVTFFMFGVKRPFRNRHS